MLYKDTGFRALYRAFSCFPIEIAKGIVEKYPGYDEADCVLTYGYIDRDAGMTLEVLACGRSDTLQFFDTDESSKIMVRIGAVLETEFVLIEDDGSLSERYKRKLDILSNYDADEEVEESRTFSFLDQCRHPEYPDDIQVHLIRKDLDTEVCWVRIEGLQAPNIIGVLLNEPYQDFGYHGGERIGFMVREDEEGNYICISDMNPSRELSRKDLDGGLLLKEAVNTFDRERNEANFIEVLELLRDSYVIVPCSAVLSDKDQKKWEELLKNADENFDSLIGETVTTSEPVRMIPDILQNGENFFFPVFSNIEEMGEYGNDFSKVEHHMLDVISLARSNETEVKGIVLNAFTQPFVLDREIFDIVENMKSRLLKIETEEE